MYSEPRFTHAVQKAALRVKAHVIELSEASPTLSFIAQFGVFVNTIDAEDDRHHQDRLSARFQNAMQLAQRLAVVRHMFQDVRADEEVELIVGVCLQIS